MGNQPEDRFATHEQEQLALQVLLKSLDDVAALANRVDLTMAPASGSSLARLDALVGPYKVSHFFAQGLAVVFGCGDSLRALLVRESAEGRQIEANPYGSYAIVRNSLDVLVPLLWLLNGHGHRERAIRRLELALEDHYRSYQAKSSLRDPNAKDWLKDRRIRLTEVAREAGLQGFDAMKTRGFTTTTAMLDEFEDHPKLSRLDLKFCWQVASGLAHGKTWANLGFHELREVSRNEAIEESIYMVTINFVPLSIIMSAIAQAGTVLLTKYVPMCQSPRVKGLSPVLRVE